MPTKKFIFIVLLINALALITAFILGKGLPKNILVTVMSATQLFAIGSVVWKIYKNRIGLDENWKAGLRTSCFVWAIVAFGFFFLAVDEIAEIHEQTDKLIHKVFQLQETGLTDRIDDLIIGVYGIIGIGVLLFYKEELMKYKEVFPLLILGFFFVFASVGFDVLTNRSDILLMIFEKKRTAWFFFEKLRIVEDGCQLLAEGVILSTFYWCLQISKKLQRA